MHLLIKKLLLVLLFGCLLSIAFLDNNRFYFIWFAFVPLLFAVEKSSLIETYLIGVVAGLCFFISATYWVVDFIVTAKNLSVGSSLWPAYVYWFYCAHLFAFILLFYNWLRRNSRIHEFLLFPVVFVTVIALFPMVFPVRPGETQANFHSALQAIEFTGVHGLDAIIALVNIMSFRLLHLCLIGKRVIVRQPLLPWSIALLSIVFWFAYGVVSLTSWNEKLLDWDTIKVGIIQPNEIPSVRKKIPFPGYSDTHPPEMDMSQRLASGGAEIIVWPEAYPKGYLDNPNIRRAYQKSISELGSTVLFQDVQHTLDSLTGRVLSQYNSAIILDNKGQLRGKYEKIKLIPFGEYIPLVTNNSWLKKQLAVFPEELSDEFQAGNHHQLFKHDQVNIVPLICYETMFPEFVGNAVGKTLKHANQSNGTVLVGLSNDGWFGSTHQPYQHVMASVLRAVENRLPFIHVVNNGPSLIVAPTGKILFKTGFREAGGYIANVPHSQTAQGSFYSRYPKLFVNVIYGLMAFIICSSFSFFKE